MREIIKREGNVVPYDRDRVSTAIFRAQASVGKADRLLAESLALEVEEALKKNYGDGSVPSVEEIQDIVENILMKKGHAETARAYIIYRNERARIRAGRISAFEATDNIPYKKIYEVLRWNMNRGCLSVNDLNAIIKRGEFPSLVSDSERRFEEEVEECARAIVSRRDEVRVVIIAGPSSSGKTTTAAKIGEYLVAAGLSFMTMNLDNYFFNLEEHPKDEFGDYDYEAPESLDLDLINEHVTALLAGKRIKAPQYDFKTGKRTLEAFELALGPEQMLLLDSLHGLNARMTAGLPASAKFSVYIETLGQLRSDDGQFMRWADNRLMRRMIRDGRVRNSLPSETLTHWHYVRRSELKNIIPFIKTADYLVNTALPYELPILKGMVSAVFPDALASYRDNPRRQDAYIRAKRVYEFLAPLSQVEDTACVPETSVIREFIGGSKYERQHAGSAQAEKTAG